jgi:hypothetical protein
MTSSQEVMPVAVVAVVAVVMLMKKAVEVLEVPLWLNSAC